MEIAQYTFESSELLSINPKNLATLGRTTFALLRNLGSPSALELVGDAPDISAYFLPTVTTHDFTLALDTMPPAYSAHTQEDGGLSAQACFPATLPGGITAISRVSYYCPNWDANKFHAGYPTRIQSAELMATGHRVRPATADDAVIIIAKSLQHILKNGTTEHVYWRTTE